jgi:16S rRNA (guanine527-N7)-methyltransferase
VDKIQKLAKDLRNILELELAKLGIEASQEEEQKILQHVALIQKECQVMNLVSLKDRGFLIERHVIPSLQGLKYIEDKPLRAICIGSGAGFPGVEVKLFKPNLQLTLLEATKKKTKFLEKVISELGLAGVDVRWERVERLTEIEYDIAMARAVAPIVKLQEWVAPILKKGGKLIAWKGSRFEEEMKEVVNPRFQVETVFPYAPPQIIVVLRKN